MPEGEIIIIQTAQLQKQKPKAIPIRMGTE